MLSHLFKCAALLRSALTICGSVFSFAAPQAVDVRAVPSAVEGRVVNSVTGGPIAGAHIALAQGKTGAAVSSDNDGYFLMDGLPAGALYLSFEKDGFAPINPFSTHCPKSVRLKPGERIRGLTIKMEPAASIAGVIVDEDSRAPVPDVTVQAMKKQHVLGQEGFFASGPAITPEKDGRYRIPNLEAGQYFIKVDIRLGTAVDAPVANTTARSKISEFGYASTFYPGGTSPDMASSVAVTAGEDRGGVDIAMRREELHKISGRITGPDGPVTGEVLVVLQQAWAGGADILARGTVRGGRFVIGRLPQGSYKLIAWTAQRNREERLVGELPLEITNRDPDELDLSLTGGMTIHGSVAPSESNATLPVPPRLQLTLEARGRLAFQDETVTGVSDLDGAFTVKNVFYGDYWYRLSGLPEDYYIEDTRFGSVSIPDNQLTIDRRSVNASLKIVVNSGAGAINGIVQDADAAPVRGATIVVGPTPLAKVSEARILRLAETGEDGRYSVRGLKPGRYSVLAFTGACGDQAMQPALLQRYSDVAIDVTVNRAAVTSVSSTVLSLF